MIFKETKLGGAFVLEVEAHQDERGSFARTWCKNEFIAHGLNPALSQCSVSFNYKRGTLRGMHYQVPPYPEAKLIRCTAGAIYDVIIDLRPDSPTYTEWTAIELTARNHRMLYVPENFAHGFQTLEDESEVFYQMSDVYDSPSARGVRWNDPCFAIHWPRAEPIISARDASYPDFVRMSPEIKV